MQLASRSVRDFLPANRFHRLTRWITFLPIERRRWFVRFSSNETAKKSREPIIGEKRLITKLSDSKSTTCPREFQRSGKIGRGKAVSGVHEAISRYKTQFLGIKFYRKTV